MNKGIEKKITHNLSDGYCHNFYARFIKYDDEVAYDVSLNLDNGGLRNLDDISNTFNIDKRIYPIEFIGCIKNEEALFYNFKSANIQKRFDKFLIVLHSDIAQCSFEYLEKEMADFLAKSEGKWSILFSDDWKDKEESLLKILMRLERVLGYYPAVFDPQNIYWENDHSDCLFFELGVRWFTHNSAFSYFLMSRGASPLRNQELDKLNCIKVINVSRNHVLEILKK